MKVYKFGGWIVQFFLMITAVACTTQGEVIDQPVISSLTQEQADELVGNAMQGLKDGNYAMWSRDWSEAMKGAINEEVFLTYRQELTNQMGSFQSVQRVTMAPSSSEGYVRWIAIANFEKGQVEFAFSFQQDGKFIEGVFPRPLS